MVNPVPLALAPDTEPSAAELVAARPQLTLHAMDGLVLEGVPLARIADAVGTPAFVYGAGTIRARLAILRAALAGLPAQIHYAVKANDRLAVLQVLAREGAGADVVSEGELRRARLAGIPANHIVFSGVGKTARELRLAVAEEIAQVNVESAEELEMLSAIAAGMGRSVRVALRVNPDVDARTHAKITTGRAENKFGVPIAAAAALYARAATLPGLHPVGVAVHIGSQILAATPYRAAYARVADLIRTLRDQGGTVEVVDCGGGLGIPYRDEPPAQPEALAGAIRATLGDLGVRLALEPGRWLVGPAGVLLASVVLVKHAAEKVLVKRGGENAPVKQSATRHRFVVLDAAMNDLVRPAMYDAWHGIVPLSAAEAAGPVSSCDVVGPVCETGDTFARNRLLPALVPSSRVAILDAGAYGAVMSSSYNARPLAAEVLVDGERWSVIAGRQTHEDLWRRESVLSWLADVPG